MNEIFLRMKSPWRNFKPKNNDSRANKDIITILIF